MCDGNRRLIVVAGKRVHGTPGCGRDQGSRQGDCGQPEAAGKALFMQEHDVWGAPSRSIRSDANFALL